LPALLVPTLDQIWIPGRNGGEAAALVAVRTGDAMFGNGAFRHIAGIHARQDLRIADLVAASAGAGVLKEIEQGHQQQTNDDPNREVPEIGIHLGSLMPWDDAMRAIRPQAPATPRRRSARSALAFNIGAYRKFAKRGWRNRRGQARGCTRGAKGSASWPALTGPALPARARWPGDKVVPQALEVGRDRPLQVLLRPECDGGHGEQ